MVLGLELTLDKVVGMRKRSLIGRLEYCKLSGPKMKKWMHLNWEPVIGYTPRFSVLMKCWFCFHFISEEDSSQVLKRFWTMQKGSMVLDNWYVSFDPESAPIRKRHLWAIFLGFPLPWWKPEILIQAENALGKFVQLDYASLRSIEKKCDIVMIEVDVTLGLPTELEILLGREVRIQHVDYWRIPFKCHYFRCAGHLRDSCPEMRTTPPETTAENDDPIVFSVDEMAKSLAVLLGS